MGGNSVLERERGKAGLFSRSADKWRMVNRLCILWLAVLMTAAPCAWAGDSGLNVIVVVNQNSSNSVQLGNDYCERRGVPPQNLFRMTGWTGGAINWQQSDFESYLLHPLLAMISSRGLTNQAQIVLLSMDIPYRVIGRRQPERHDFGALLRFQNQHRARRRACPPPVPCRMIRPTATPTANCPSRWRRRPRPAQTPSWR